MQCIAKEEKVYFTFFIEEDNFWKINFDFKGRTGTIICVWLLESGECKNAKEALLKFGDRRTNWDKGTTFQGKFKKKITRVFDR